MNLAHNLISSFDEVKILSRFPDIIEITLEGNSISNDKNYRKIIYEIFNDQNIESNNGFTLDGVKGNDNNTTPSSTPKLTPKQRLISSVKKINQMNNVTKMISNNKKKIINKNSNKRKVGYIIIIIILYLVCKKRSNS